MSFVKRVFSGEEAPMLSGSDHEKLRRTSTYATPCGSVPSRLGGGLCCSMSGSPLSFPEWPVCSWSAYSGHLLRWSDCPLRKPFGQAFVLLYPSGRLPTPERPCGGWRFLAHARGCVKALQAGKRILVAVGAKADLPLAVTWDGAAGGRSVLLLNAFALTEPAPERR